MFHAHKHSDLVWYVYREGEFLFYLEDVEFSYVNQLMANLNKANYK